MAIAYESATGSSSARRGAGCGAPRFLLVLRLPAIWWDRHQFRAQLREDLAGDPRRLTDLGIDIADACVEARRFFWEPVRLER
jgi:uncharacterized protein YjiS (DUF1127 family)